MIDPASKSASAGPTKGSVGARAYIGRLQNSPLVAQGMRYVLSGCVVSTVYLLTTSLLSLAVGLPFQAALAIGFAAALSVHFTMQRLFVWTDHDAFALAFRSQMGRYLLVAATQYGLTVASTSLVPPALGLSVELVYVATSLSMASVNFLLYRYHIFHGIS